MTTTVPMERITSKIYLIRNIKVMLDKDLADLYGVETRVLNQAVKRHKKRFPDDFMFQLSRSEYESLISQFVTSKKPGRGGIRKMPYAFTEQGVAMLSGILNSDRAIAANIQIMRTFTRLRQAILDNADLRKEFEDLKQISEDRFQIVFETLDQLINIENTEKKKIGFTVKEKQKAYGKSMPKAAHVEFSLTPQAQVIWDSIPGDFQMKLLNNVWCRTCSDVTGIGSIKGIFI